MLHITVKDGEHIERALKRFTRRVEQSGVLKEVKRRRYYEKPSVQRKRKEKEAQRRARKAARSAREELS